MQRQIRALWRAGGRATLTGGDDARGTPSEDAVRLGVENAVDAAGRAAEAGLSAAGAATRPAALVALERAAHRAVVVGSVDAGEAVGARTNWKKKVRPE